MALFTCWCGKTKSGQPYGSAKTYEWFCERHQTNKPVITQAKLKPIKQVKKVTVVR